MYMSSTVIPSLFTGLLAISPVAADFLIFAGAENQDPDPAETSIVLFFNNPPSCHDVTSVAIQWTIEGNNDASHGGVACDGCGGGAAPQDWDPTRFEVYDDNSNTFSMDDLHFTLYQDPMTGGYGMYDTNMNSLGSCVKPNPVQIANCPDFGSADSVAGIFHCTTSITIKNSN